MSKEKIIIVLLASINFTHIIDFIIIMPLGPQLMRKLKVSPQEFSLIVSVYTISAAITGFLSSFFADKFDRKKIVLIGYFFFLTGTLLCGLSQNYLSLLIARIIAGAGGGLLASQVNAIVADLVPYERRGAAMGILGMAFSLASVIGIPLGLYLGNHWSWEIAFYFIVMIGCVVFPMIWIVLPRMTAHLSDKKHNPFAILQSVRKDKKQQLGLMLISTVMLGSFTMIPFISPYMVANVGFKEDDLTYIYFIGGLLTFFISPYVGRLSDKIGKFKILQYCLFLCIIPLFLVTNLPKVSMFVALSVTSLFFVFISARHSPANAIISNLSPPNLRGSYMGLIASAQNLMSGLAAAISGFIIVKADDGQLLHYNYVGYIAIFFTLLCVYVSVLLNKEISKSVE
ncbi:MAG: MFS transporter [Cytophagia bacterium]|nr:MAG: MFS transporter [Cytophagia bacterium]TAG46391.1 MAG: MFS transporter [Cytophagia bacterium]